MACTVAYEDLVIFIGILPLQSGSISDFLLGFPYCTCHPTWVVGDSSGSMDLVLPVELLDFSASSADHAVLLNFTTASETDNDVFEVYRADSPDGPFTQIARIPSRGPSSTPQDYTCRDSAVLPGHCYWYYLADVDLSGNRTEHSDWLRSATVSQSAVITEYALTAYPNPFNPTTTIEFSLPEAGPVRLAVYDVNGRQVRNLADAQLTAGAHSIRFTASDLPFGIYLARLSAGTTQLTRKLLLVK